ncbi:MAG: stage III sporulation protein AG [Clostridia bacterium]|nr:stage III sporulation protein AG [Clostridia bacterium]
MGDLIKSLFPEDKSQNSLKVNGKQKKYISLLALVAVFGVLAIFVGNFAGGNEEQSPLIAGEPKVVNSSGGGMGELAAAEQQMAERLEKILSQIAGIGEVAVNLTLESSSEYQYAINQQVDKTLVTERAQDGSTRTTDETREDAQIVMKNMAQGKNEPVIVKEIRPQVVGVMIVAEGANNPLTREEISKAVQTLLNIPAHRVTVLPKGE